MVLHRFGPENKFVFLGQGNKIYSVGLVEGSEKPAEVHVVAEENEAEEAGQLKKWELKADSSEDVSAVQITGTSDEAWWILY